MEDPAANWKLQSSRDHVKFHYEAALFPHYFTLVALAVFGVPVVAGFQLLQDPTVQYWVRCSPYTAVVIPFYLLLCHCWHLRLRRPKLVPIICSTVVPGMFVFFSRHILWSRHWHHSHAVGIHRLHNAGRKAGVAPRLDCSCAAVRRFCEPHGDGRGNFVSGGPEDLATSGVWRVHCWNWECG